MLSVVIPTLNEEENIKQCISCVKKQGIKNTEIIVVDINSSDKTVAIAKECGARVLKYTPKNKRSSYISAQRNLGAKHAKFDTILFLDADTFLYDTGLVGVLLHFNSSECNILTTRLIIDSDRARYKIINSFYHLASIITFFNPIMPGAFVIVRKEAHNRIGGWDESVMVGEDHEYAGRARELYKICRYLSYNFYTSPRRFETNGFINTLALWVALALSALVRGAIKRDNTSYTFGNYD